MAYVHTQSTNQKDILFLCPIYYIDHFVDRMDQYLRESKTHRTYDVLFICSKSAIASVAKQKAWSKRYLFQERGNYGGGEGALWYAQAKSGIDFSSYRYVWYMEESCEPRRTEWIDRLIDDMDNGVPLVGWDWHSEAKRREGQISHIISGKNCNTMIAYENTRDTGVDSDGQPHDGVWDTPCYRDEMFIVSSKDFMEFKYPDATDPFWEQRNGNRTYGVRAERQWWSMADQARHGYPLPSPNIQWTVMQKHSYVPSKKNIYFSYFWELPYKTRLDSSYVPPSFFVRTLLSIIHRIMTKIKTFV